MVFLKLVFIMNKFRNNSNSKYNPLKTKERHDLMKTLFGVGTSIIIRKLLRGDILKNTEQT